MMEEAISASLAHFRDAIAQRFGLAWPETQLYVLADVVQQRASLHQRSVSDYIEQLVAHGMDAQEWSVLSEALTVGETYFFRGREQLDAFIGGAIPALLAKSPRRELRILSAGCSSGEEPYTLAMLLRERHQDVAPDSWSITGIDINAEALRRASKGLYAAWSLRDTPEGTRSAHFTTIGRSFKLSDQLRSNVRFEERNLIDRDQNFWTARRFDIIFCRNVLMYLTPLAASEVLRRMVRSLAPDGYLFLGSAETVRGLTTAFSLCQSHGAFYYRLGEPVTERVCAIAPTPTTDMNAGPADSDSMEWFDLIDRSSRRVAQLTSTDEGRVAPSPPSAGKRDLTGVESADELQPIVELIRQERFAEVAPAIAGLTAAGQSHPLAQVIGAVALVHGGEVGPAQLICEEVLRTHPGSDLADYLLGLCWEQSGDLAQAESAYRRIIARTSSFAMAQVRLAQLAQRRQDAPAAVAHASAAMAAIEVDLDLHFALFSGGLPRRAIRDLCLGLAQGRPHGP